MFVHCCGCFVAAADQFVRAGVNEVGSMVMAAAIIGSDAHARLKVTSAILNFPPFSQEIIEQSVKVGETVGAAAPEGTAATASKDWKA